MCTYDDLFCSTRDQNVTQGQFSVGGILQNSKLLWGQDKNYLVLLTFSFRSTTFTRK